MFAQQKEVPVEKSFEKGKISKVKNGEVKGTKKELAESIRLNEGEQKVKINSAKVTVEREKANAVLQPK